MTREQIDFDPNAAARHPAKLWTKETPVVHAADYQRLLDLYEATALRAAASELKHQHLQAEMQHPDFYLRAINCPHTIDKDKVILHFDPKADGHNALNQLARRLTTTRAVEAPACQLKHSPVPQNSQKVDDNLPVSFHDIFPACITLHGEKAVSVLRDTVAKCLEEDRYAFSLIVPAEGQICLGHWVDDQFMPYAILTTEEAELLVFGIFFAASNHENMGVDDFRLYSTDQCFEIRGVEDDRIECDVKVSRNSKPGFTVHCNIDPLERYHSANTNRQE